MDETKTKESHEERTAYEPRDMTLHDVILSQVTPVGSLVRLFRLAIPSGQPDIKFLPGQWVDCFVPGIAKAGGFTITSTPSRAVTGPDADPEGRYIELAVKASPENPAAAWLWQDPVASILGQTLHVRIGGSFVYPPPGLDLRAPSHGRAPARIVFVAGGVGINPLISMVCHLGEQNGASADAGDGGRAGPEVVFLYSVRAESTAAKDGEDSGDRNGPAGRILFMQRLASLYSRKAVWGQLKVFLTAGESGAAADGGSLLCNGESVPCERRRITTADVDAAVLGGTGRTDNVYVYVCGVPAMTDGFVAHLTDSKSSGGLALLPHQVLYEKWW